jgi:hypothetical protein
MTLAFRSQACTVTRVNAARCKMDLANSTRCNEHARPIRLHGLKVAGDRTNFKDTMLLGSYAGYTAHSVKKPLRSGYTPTLTEIRDSRWGVHGNRPWTKWNVKAIKISQGRTKNKQRGLSDRLRLLFPSGPSWKTTPLSNSAHGSLGGMLWSSRRLTLSINTEWEHRTYYIKAWWWR